MTSPDIFASNRYNSLRFLQKLGLSMKTPEQYYAQARDIFFSAHPDFQVALDEVTEKDARE